MPKFNLTKEEWELLATYIKDNCCGCFYNNFNGKVLKKSMTGLE